MGITNLLKYVQNACRQGRIEEFQGKTIAVDVSCFLHKALTSCYGKIITGQETDMYIKYVRKYVDVLLNNGCHVILVFDGLPLPAKQDVHNIRKELREKNLKLSEQRRSEGNLIQADKYLRQSVTITREIIQNTIRAMKNLVRVDILVAPYEADAQLAYLLQTQIAQAVITEDSDLIVYGCDNIIFKFNEIGDCIIYEKAKLSLCLDFRLRQDFDFSIFRRICILIGCDYLKQGLTNIGWQKAQEIFVKLRIHNNNIKHLLRRIPIVINSKIKVTSKFIEEFIKAEQTFLYQTIFDPIEREHKSLNPLPDSTDMSLLNNSPKCEFVQMQEYTGKVFPQSQAIRLALGNSLEDLYQPSIKDLFVLHEANSWSIWHSSFKHNSNITNSIKQQNFGNSSAFQLPISIERISNKENVRKRSTQDNSRPKEEHSQKKSCNSLFKEADGRSTSRIKNSMINHTDSASDWLRLYGTRSQEDISSNSKSSVLLDYQSQSASQSSSEASECCNSSFVESLSLGTFYEPVNLQATSFPIDDVKSMEHKKSPYFSGTKSKLLKLNPFNQHVSEVQSSFESLKNTPFKTLDLIENKDSSISASLFRGVKINLQSTN